MEKEKKKPRLESWSFYSNSHDFHMLLIVVPTWSVSDSLQPHGLPGSSVHGILQARILEWVAISFFRGSSRPRDQTRVSCTADRVFTKWAMREAQRESESDSVLSDSLQPIVHGILQARILEWVAFPFSRGSSQPRDQTQISHIAGRFFTSWATRETHVNATL